MPERHEPIEYWCDGCESATECQVNAERFNATFEREDGLREYLNEEGFGECWAAIDDKWETLWHTPAPSGIDACVKYYDGRTEVFPVIALLHQRYKKTEYRFIQAGGGKHKVISSVNQNQIHRVRVVPGIWWADCVDYPNGMDYYTEIKALEHSWLAQSIKIVRSEDY